MKRTDGKGQEKAQVQELNALQSSMPKHIKPYIGDDGGFYAVNFKGGDPNNIDNYEEVPVNNASLRYDEFRRIDDAVTQVAESELIGVQDLRDNNLVYPLNNPMATTVLTWEEMSDAGEANVGINPVKRGRSFAPEFTQSHLPIPVTFVNYQIGERFLQESRTRGNGIDTVNAERAGRKVAEKFENMLFGSSDILTYGGGTIHTYLSHPDILTQTLNENWDASGKTVDEIKNDINSMIQKSRDNYYRGPWMLYTPLSYRKVLDDDYNVSGSSTQTVRQRLEAFEGIQGVKTVDALPANTVLLVEMSRSVVEWVDGMSVQNIEWSSEGGLLHHYKIMGIQLPRIRSDYNGKTGIVKLA